MEEPQISPAPPKSFKEKRESFFARREGVFLWLLAPPTLIAGGIILILVLLWLARQIALLSGLLTPAHIAN